MGILSKINKRTKPNKRTSQINLPIGILSKINKSTNEIGNSSKILKCTKKA